MSAPGGPGSAGDDPSTYLMHRPPILCLERIVTAEAESVICAGVVRDGPLAAAGRLWEGALVEGLSQAAGVLNGLHARRRGAAPEAGMLVGIRALEIARRPAVGEEVAYEVRLIKRLDPVTLMHGTARVGDEVVASGELKFYAAAAAAGGAGGPP